MLRAAPPVGPARVRLGLGRRRDDSLRRAPRSNQDCAPNMIAHRGTALKAGLTGRTPYRRSVSAGLAEPPESPWRDAYQGWVLGSGPFVDRVRARVRGQLRREQRRESRLIEGVPLERVCEAVCST
jgi:hypothetical protein